MYEPVYGHIWLSSTPVAWVVYRDVTYQVSINPGFVPDIPDQAKGPQIIELNRQHLVLRHVYDTYHLANKPWCTLVLAAIPSIFLEPLKLSTLGFGSCTTLQTLTHLREPYGQIDDNQLPLNAEAIKALWQSPTPVKTLFLQLKDCQAFSVIGNNTIIDASEICTGVSNIEATP